MAEMNRLVYIYEQKIREGGSSELADELDQQNALVAKVKDQMIRYQEQKAKFGELKEEVAALHLKNRAMDIERINLWGKLKNAIRVVSNIRADNKKFNVRARQLERKREKLIASQSEGFTHAK